MELVPRLAERWEVSPDRLTYTFTLRPGIKYGDGQPIVAADFVYAIDRLLAPETASPGAGFYTGIAGGQDRLSGKAADTDAGADYCDARADACAHLCPCSREILVVLRSGLKKRKESHCLAPKFLRRNWRRLRRHSLSVSETFVSTEFPGRPTRYGKTTTHYALRITHYANCASEHPRERVR
jgi:hypothetical protein